MPITFTTVPTVLSALVALGTSVLPSTVRVFDGAPNTDDLPNEFLCVGYSRDEDDASVDGELADMGNRVGSEQYAVHCVLSVSTGDIDGQAVGDRRAQLSSLLGTFGQAVRSDPSLGSTLGTFGRATLGSISWIYGPSLQGGTYAEVEFDVNVVAEYLGMT